MLCTVFSMAISTNLFATLLLYCVSVKFELAIPFSTLRFTFLHVSLCGTVLTWGWSQGTGACATGLATPPWKWPETQITTDPGTVIEQRHAGGSFPFIH